MGVIATGLISLEHLNPGERVVALTQPGRLDGAESYSVALSLTRRTRMLTTIWQVCLRDGLTLRAFVRHLNAWSGVTT
ncbi:hypothetical protein PUN4_230041 [Paraburkholderia unamae]|nr:hypothetical protein PUN4_230041 [Paraburkholderia unamae]